jgi:hypothetical protein
MAMTPHWDELRTLQCGPAPPEIEPPLPSDADWRMPEEKDIAHLKGWAKVYAHMEPSARRHLEKLARRQVCWLKFLEPLRKQLSDEYLKAHP